MRRQSQGAFRKIANELSGRITLAYEPVWAIGTGKTATPEIAADAHRAIRDQARAKYGNGAVRILYGGSVKPDNIKGLMAQVSQLALAPVKGHARQRERQRGRP